ncbi:uncharacterized protein BCR38DRAFT_10881 [Pseudomassariella vexata]|uniref:BTB domain-containing protein n=1 Tax=Pseudomassariella vexata TaxID=1141098 RepID=A0A1Y2EIQ7_9PEZI|nr:uncharacterized protein BCR38DRAFT_10881 [Pseudomassariella vexata]ORY71472.1 hypothetical protein BCR38DRAFT_10881 [Pseudomassariella vexata]
MTSRPSQRSSQKRSRDSWWAAEENNEDERTERRPAPALRARSRQDLHDHDEPYRLIPNRREILDPEGDLLFVAGDRAAGDDLVAFKVCSRTVFRKIPGWRDLQCLSKPPDAEEWILRIPDVKPNAVLIILNILHSNFDQIPVGKSLGSQDLLDVTVLTTRYEVTSLLRPWADGWTRSFTEVLDRHTRNNEQNSAEELPLPLDTYLWITWEFGHAIAFKNTLRELAWSTTIREGSLRLRNEPLFSKSKEPSGAYSVIYAARLDIIKSLLQPLEKLVNKLSTFVPYNSVTEVGKDESLLATLFANLRRYELGEILSYSSPEDWTGSAYDLVEKLWLAFRASRLEHCTSNLSSLFKDTKNELTTTIENGTMPEMADFQTRYLEARANLTGLES